MFMLRLVNIASWFRSLDVNKNNNEKTTSFSNVDAEKNAKKRGGKGKSTVNGQHQRLDESKLL